MSLGSFVIVQLSQSGLTQTPLVEPHTQAVPGVAGTSIAWQPQAMMHHACVQLVLTTLGSLLASGSAILRSANSAPNLVSQENFSGKCYPGLGIIGFFGVCALIFLVSGADL